MAHIYINAGHGGSDPGAVGKVIEEHANLAVSLMLQKLLEDAGHRVTMSRVDDRTVSMREACDAANACKADLFVSVHHNAGGGDGYEVIHSIYHGVGEKLAQAISRHMALWNNPHGTRPVYAREGKHGDYYMVIRETHMPAVIVEGAFVDSKDADIITGDGLVMEAQAIADGILEHLRADQ